MRVQHLSLTDFRNYAEAEVTFPAGATLIVGRNGQGKTNLVEAVGFLSTLGSHRVSTDHALIRAGRDAAIIRARLEYNGRDILTEVQINRSGANRAQVNHSVIKTRELPRYCHSILFAPEDLALVRGDPAGRRRFLDQLLVQRAPRIAGVIADYERVLKQRNTLLKSARASGLRESRLTTLDIWDERLVSLGSEIVVARARLTAALAEPLRVAYRAVAGGDHHPELVPQLSVLGADPEEGTAAASLEPVGQTPPVQHVEIGGGAGSPGEAHATDPIGDTQPGGSMAEGEGSAGRGQGSHAAGAASDGIAASFRSAIAGLRRKELDRGITLVGPHRDDLVFMLNGLPAKGYASHGESWSFALALKLASAELLRRDSSSGDPVLILDDVFAELDQTRRRRLAEAVTGFEQVLITAAVLEDVPEALAQNTVQVQAGVIVDV
ncbi:DNA replication/repair protein RecF [Luethyella okanaganae]|uniref:DNA replication and repair protein RecF n=1 Tax=Luethyella okanaganae TaxID=69372 RepID=A0ABW1VFN5_9MICO